MSEVTAQKIQRLRGGGQPRVLDLFAGCGGLSLGFQAAGFEIAGAVEFDEHAAASHGWNFHRGDRRHAVPRDITVTSPQKLADELDLGSAEYAIDVIVGGPPCQAFARVGRAKLREIEAHPEAWLRDPRARLYTSYLHYVDVMQPLAILMENVPDVLNHGGQNIAAEICEVLEAKGYVCGYTLLNSVFYGVPQMRERMFLLGYRQELGAAVHFPRPERWHELPDGYKGSRAVALKVLSGLFARAHDYIEPPFVDPALPPAVTAQEAIGDLPPILARDELRTGRLRRGTRRFAKPGIGYDPTRPVSDYAARMKGWAGFEAPVEGLYDHQIRYLPRDYALFALMRPGSEYPELHRLAMKRFESEASRLGLMPLSAEWNHLQSTMAPPYDPGKLPNKWWKLRKDPAVQASNGNQSAYKSSVTKESKLVNVWTVDCRSIDYCPSRQVHGA